MPRAPTEDQLRRASRRNLYGAGVVERLRYDARHPLDVLPTAAKRRELTQANEDVARRGMAAARSDASIIAPAPRADDAVLDRILRGLFRFSPTRLTVQCVFNPWTPIPTTGLNIPPRYLISHVVHSPHPSALWDIQILHPDPGALDELGRQIELADKSPGLRWRTYRAMAQRAGYYDYLRGLVERIRRFDYPPSPPGFDPILENLVKFLNHAAAL